MEKFIAFFEDIMPLIKKYSISILIAIVVLIVGWWIINRIVKIMGQKMEKKGVEASLRPFLLNITKFTLRLLLIVSIASMMGLQMTSFVAVIGAAGLAIGLALQGSLANFAGGVIILLLKPFKVDDFIETSGFMGTVREIHVFYTYLTTPDQQEMIVPNGKLANADIKNYSFHPIRRMDIAFRVVYEANLDKVKAILNELIESEEGLVREKGFEHSIFITDLNDQCMIVNLRAFLKSGDYWPIRHGLREKVKLRFDKENISFHYPKMEITTEK